MNNQQRPAAHAQLLALSREVRRSHPRARLIRVTVELTDGERTFTLTRQPRSTS